MRVPYPKSAREIGIKESILPNEDSPNPRAARGEQPMLLSDKIVEYLYTHDFGKGHVLEIVMQVLTVGKVRVEFSDRFERLELADHDDKISRTQVTAMFDDFIEEVTKGNDGADAAAVTQRISIASKKTSAPMNISAPSALPRPPVTTARPASTPPAPPAKLAEAASRPAIPRPGASAAPAAAAQQRTTVLPANPTEGSKDAGFMSKLKRIFGG